MNAHPPTVQRGGIARGAVHPADLAPPAAELTAVHLITKLEGPVDRRTVARFSVEPGAARIKRLHRDLRLGTDCGLAMGLGVTLILVKRRASTTHLCA
jgi:hypothetical protein